MEQLDPLRPERPPRRRTQAGRWTFSVVTIAIAALLLFLVLRANIQGAEIPKPLLVAVVAGFGAVILLGTWSLVRALAGEEVLGHTVHELMIWEDPADRVRMVAQLQQSGPVRNVITRLRTKSGEIKLAGYSAQRIQFDGQSCILAVSEDLPDYDQQKLN